MAILVVIPIGRIIFVNGVVTKVAMKWLAWVISPWNDRAAIGELNAVQAVDPDLLEHLHFFAGIGASAKGWMFRSGAKPLKENVLRVRQGFKPWLITPILL